ncbi:MAG: hypothetical protein QG577_2909 [Thermodesulfobacteriota bacterium]|nr:hypothetical protein [Thermodesulfobacteriota bacterium]
MGPFPPCSAILSEWSAVSISQFSWETTLSTAGAIRCNGRFTIGNRAKDVLFTVKISINPSAFPHRPIIKIVNPDPEDMRQSLRTEVRRELQDHSTSRRIDLSSQCR